MTDWEDYANHNPQTARFWEVEPVQKMRAEVIAKRCVGSVLDVGGGDGFIAGLIRDRGNHVEVRDISRVRVERCQDQRLHARVADAEDLPDEHDSFDTVVLGEILEHLPNPGPALTEACRVARRRVVISLPLNGWADPTHRWRIRLDCVDDPAQHAQDPTKGQQIILTLEKGGCWPADYWEDDEAWHELFGADE